MNLLSSFQMACVARCLCMYGWFETHCSSPNCHLWQTTGAFLPRFRHLHYNMFLSFVPLRICDLNTICLPNYTNPKHSHRSYRSFSYSLSLTFLFASCSLCLSPTTDTPQPFSLPNSSTTITVITSPFSFIFRCCLWRWVFSETWKSKPYSRSWEYSYVFIIIFFFIKTILCLKGQ